MKVYGLYCTHLGHVTMFDPDRGRYSFEQDDIAPRLWAEYADCLNALPVMLGLGIVGPWFVMTYELSLVDEGLVA